jgi:hypothetical protein
VVDEAVAYARYERERKIASLAAFRRVPGIRADLALASLGRAYVSWCWERDRRWTSGLHVLWWSISRLAEIPSDPGPTELHETDSGVPLGRLVSIAKWTVMVLRLYLVSDIGRNAQRADDEAGILAELTDEALAATAPGDAAGLAKWLRGKSARVTRALPEKRYEELASALRRRRD